MRGERSYMNKGIMYENAKHQMKIAFQDGVRYFDGISR